MFSISAINDTESREQWEPLAPTKEAREFHLSQTYHDGLLKLQAKEFTKARALLETVLKDPLISGAQVETNATDGHLLQLRFLAMKNLAAVFLEQGPAYYENALSCYLQAVEIDPKDSVVWNQLGTLSCSMGLLSISRWAFEQGLTCSPNNWNCMEKLLEVLIAIGDEVACLSVAKLILRHWPSHSRAIHVKDAIEGTESISFAPRGIDTLTPKHVRLKFLDKRKLEVDSLDEKIMSKRLNYNIELHLVEVSWTALAGALLGILKSTSVCCPEPGTEKCYRSGDVKLTIHLPQSSENATRCAERNDPTFNLDGGCMSVSETNHEKEKDSIMYEEQPQERRSSRLERLRNRKPSKEELDFAITKDLAKTVIQCLEPFVVEQTESKNLNSTSDHSLPSVDAVTNSLDDEFSDVTRFIEQTLNNYGAYHMGHLLLEEVSKRCILYQNDLARVLELEKLTRHWGKPRSPGCSLFLAELYNDFGSGCPDMSRLSDSMVEASYHICKIIEAVALSYPFHVGGENHYSLADGSQRNCEILNVSGSNLASDRSFWVRFYWLGGQLSVFDGNKEKAQGQFCLALSLLTNDTTNDSIFSVSLPHCRFVRELTRDAILHKINLIDVDSLLKKTVPFMFEQDMHLECINLLARLLFSSKDIYLDVPCITGKEGEGVTSVELSALDVLIQACEKTNLIDIKVQLNCHLRRLQILMVASGIECFASSKKFHKISELRTLEATEAISKKWNQMVAEEVKAISQSATQLKNFIFPCADSDGVNVTQIIGAIQGLLLTFMCHIANTKFSRKSACSGISDKNEEQQKFCFVDAAISFCKLQHLNPRVPVKAQVELITAIHDMLAEYGICCAAGSGEEEGTFLKFAIKHLLALDMKLKSNLQPLSKRQETSQSNEHLSHDNHSKGPDKSCDDINVNKSRNESSPDVLDLNVCQSFTDQSSVIEKKPDEAINSNNDASNENLKDDQTGGECIKNFVEKVDGTSGREGEKVSDHSLEYEKELTKEEREELELSIDNALDQCFFCLYGLNLRSDSSYEDDLAMHKNSSRGDYQTKEQCDDVFQYILPYAKASSRTGLIKLRRVLRAIRKHFPQPPNDVLAGNAVKKFLDDPNLCEDKLSEEAGSDGFLDSIMKIFSETGSLKQQKMSSLGSSEPYLEVYSNLYYLLALSEEMSASDKWAGFVLTKEGEEFVEQNANLFKYDLLYNPMRFESWQRLANIYDEEVDLLLNDGSKQINVEGWRKNATLSQRVETSRRRSRRCLLMTLALAKTAAQQGEIHELLALVYYDGIQNVVPFYDQRSNAPSRDAVWMMFCQNSRRHFKKAFAHKKDWSHAYYLGKLSEKLGYSHDISFSYYDKALNLNPSAVDCFYRMHASRLKLLHKCGKENHQALKVVAAYSFSQSTKEKIMTNFGKMGAETADFSLCVQKVVTDVNSGDKMHMDSQLAEAWHILYNDCLSALEICVEGDLKHFHKARFMLAQGLYRRGESGDIEKAKEELSFCFKSSRSSFTFNMWEIDGMVKKGRRKTPGSSGSRKVLEVNLPESSRKFITCIRKYILFYLKLLEVTGDICTLDRAYISIRADKRFNLCLEDLVPVALRRYINALIFTIHQTEVSHGALSTSVEHLLEKMFSLYLEQMNLWSDLCGIPEIKNPELTECSLYGHLYRYIQLLERNARLETLEGINEKLRKRLKNTKLSNNDCAKLYKHVSFAWCRTLVTSMSLITPLHTRISSDMNVSNLPDSGHENVQLLCVDLQTDELWDLSLEDRSHLKSLEAKWNSVLSKIKNVIIKRASDEDLDTATLLLRSSYNFYRDTSCSVLPSGINLYMVPSQLAAETYIQPGIDGVDILDMSTPRKLLLWAYTLLHGHCTSISTVVRYCEDNAKLRMRKGTGNSAISSNICLLTATSHTGDGKDGMTKCTELEAAPTPTSAVSTLPERKNSTTHTPQTESPRHMESVAGSLCNLNSGTSAQTEIACPVSSALGEDRIICGPNLIYSGESQKLSSSPQDMLHRSNTHINKNVEDVQGGHLHGKR